MLEKAGQGTFLTRCFYRQIVERCQDPREAPQTLHSGYLGAVLKIAQVLDKFCRKIPIETDNAEAFGKLYKDCIFEMLRQQQGVSHAEIAL